MVRWTVLGGPDAMSRRTEKRSLDGGSLAFSTLAADRVCESCIDS